MLVLGLLSVGLTSCTTPSIIKCGPNDVPIRLSKDVISRLSDQEVKDILAFNESLVDKGCAKPNKQ